MTRGEELFGEAVELDRESRDRLLASAETAVRVEAVELLNDHDRAGDFLTVSPDDVWTGQTLLNRYRVDRFLARGGTASVYVAHDLQLAGRRVVVKFLHSWARNVEWLRENVKAEMRALARIEHPGVVGVLDFGTAPDGLPFMVIEFVDGHTLRTELQGGPIEPRRAAALLRQIGEAVHAAHECNVLHRDVKPENIMVSGDVVRLIDFGIARVEDIPSGMTQTTQFAGTTPYMAPEQLRGKTVVASDIFALGVVAFEMQTGRRPFDATSPVELFEQQRAGLKRGGAIARELSFRPEERSQSAREAANAMATAMLRGDVWWTRRRIAAALAGGVSAASPGIWYLWPDAPLTAVERVIELPPGKEPEENGWQIAGDMIWRAVYNADATGVIANRLITNAQGRYIHPLTRKQAAAAVRNGWVIFWEADVQEGGNIVHLDFPGAARRFSLNLLRDPDGGDQVLLPTVIGAKTDGLRWVVPGLTGQRHRFAMRWNASTGLASVEVDGHTRISGYAGMNEFRDRRGFEISVGRYKSQGASGVVWLARLEIGQSG